MNRFINILIITFILLTCTFSVCAQTENLDSLELLLQTQKLSSSEQSKLYYKLSWGYMDVNTEKTFSYAKKGIQFAEKERDMEWATQLYCNLGVAYDMVSKYDSALLCFDKSIAIALQNKNERQEARGYICIGNLYLVKGDYQLSLEYFMKALPMLEKQGDPQRLGILLHNIGAVYQFLFNMEQAKKYFLRVEKIVRETGDKDGLAAVFVSLCDIGLNEGDDIDKSLDYAKSAVDLYHEINNKYGESNALLSMAKCCYLLADYNVALGYAQMSLQLSEELDYPKLTSLSYAIMSDIYYYQKYYNKCEEYALKAEATDTTDAIALINLTANLTRANIQMHNSLAAIEYFDRYKSLINHHAAKEFQRTLSEMEVKYESEKKELKIAAMLSERKLFIWLSLAGGAILLLLLAFVIVRQRMAVNRRKMAEQQVKQLEQEKQLVATQAVLDGETAERTRLARDLHDGLGGMLSVVKLHLNDVKKGAIFKGEDVVYFNQALDVLEKSISELREMAHNMMPEALTRFGLKVAVSDFCNKIPGAELHYFGYDNRLDTKLEMMIYRTIQELVNNALKHSGAKQIIVQIVHDVDRLALTVQDDGCGFDTKAETAGTGLNNIRNRVESYNGYIDIWSHIGSGTEINLEFKLI